MTDRQYVHSLFMLAEMQDRIEQCKSIVLNAMNFLNALKINGIDIEFIEGSQIDSLKNLDQLKGFIELARKQIQAKNERKTN